MRAGARRPWPGMRGRRAALWADRRPPTGRVSRRFATLVFRYDPARLRGITGEHPEERGTQQPATASSPPVEPDGRARHSPNEAAAPSEGAASGVVPRVPATPVLVPVQARDEDTHDEARLLPPPPARRGGPQPFLPDHGRIHAGLLGERRHLPQVDADARRRRARLQRVRVLRWPAFRQRPAPLRSPPDRLRQGRGGPLPDHEGPPRRAPLRLGHPRPARRT